MTSDRPYRKGMDPAIAFAEVEKMAGKQFDRESRAAFLAIKDRIAEEMKAPAVLMMAPVDGK